MVTVWEKYDSYEQTDNQNCPECGTPNACNIHRWLNAKWYNNYKIEKKKLTEI